MKPEQAVEAARRSLATERDRGSYRTNLRTLKINATAERVSSDQLMEWSLIEPDPDLIGSTRRWGAPISAVKRAVLHLLRQYHGQLESQQTRFNVHLLARVVELEDRLGLVEDWLREETPAGEQPSVAPRRGEVDDRYLLEDWIAGPARGRHEWLPPVPGSAAAGAPSPGTSRPGAQRGSSLPHGLAGAGPLEGGMPSPIAPIPGAPTARPGAPADTQPPGEAGDPAPAEPDRARPGPGAQR